MEIIEQLACIPWLNPGDLDTRKTVKPDFPTLGTYLLLVAADGIAPPTFWDMNPMRYCFSTLRQTIFSMYAGHDYPATLCRKVRGTSVRVVSDIIAIYTKSKVYNKL